MQVGSWPEGPRGIPAKMLASMAFSDPEVLSGAVGPVARLERSPEDLCTCIVQKGTHDKAGLFSVMPMPSPRLQGDAGTSHGSVLQRWRHHDDLRGRRLQRFSFGAESAWLGIEIVCSEAAIGWSQGAV